MELTDTQVRLLTLFLGTFIVLQAGVGAYFLINGETTNAVISFSTLAALSGSMAAINVDRDDDN